MDTKSAGFFFAAYRKICNSYIDFLMRSLSDYTLSPNEIVVLSSVGEIKTASEIAVAADVSKALVSRSVKLLKERGCIATTLSGTDKREQNLALTDKGAEIAKKINDAQNSFFDEAFFNFEENEKLVLRALLSMMMKNLNVL